MLHVRRCVGLLALLVACVVVSGAAARKTVPSSSTGESGGAMSTWDETTVCTATCSGTYTGVYTLSPSTLSGTLVSGGQTYTVTTTRNGASFTMHTTGPGNYSSDAKGTLSADGKSMSGTFSDVQSGSGTWSAKLVSGPPAQTAPGGATTACSAKTTQGVGTSPLNVTTELMPGGKGVVLNLSHVNGASTLGVDLTGDGHPDYAAPASLPFVGIVSPVTIRRTINVTATCESGTTFRQPVKLLIPGVGQPAKGAPTSVVFSSRNILLTDVLCTDAALIQDLIEARGCFKAFTSPDQPRFPAAEQATAKAYYGSNGLSAIPGYRVYVSHDPVRVNGLTVTPQGSGSIVVDPGSLRIYSSDAKVKLGSIPLQSGQIDLDFTDASLHSQRRADGTYPDAETKPVLTFDARKGIPLIGGFPINAGAELAFAVRNGVRQSRITVHVELPSLFDVFGDGPQPSAAGTGVVTNDAPFKIGTLDLNVPHASIGGIGFDDVSFHYDADGDKDAGCKSQYWHATAAIHLGNGPNGEPGAGFRLVPPPSQNGIAFCDGDFKSAGGEIAFGVPIPPPEIFPAVFLDKINFAIQTNPLLLRGGATISAAELFSISGTLLAAFATPSAPYTLTKGDAGVELQDVAPRTFTATTFAVGGAFDLKVPGAGMLNVAHGGLLYTYPDYFYAAAHVDVQLGIFYFTGSLAASGNVRTKHFEADLEAHICVREPHLCGGGLAIVSSKGVLACLDIAGLHPGVGVTASGKPDLYLPDGCKPSHYWVRDVQERRHAARTGTISFEVAHGETTKSVRIAGVGGAPKVLVQGPGGVRLSLDGDGLKRSGPLSGVRGTTFKATYIGVDHGTPGRYTITVLPGSVPLGQLKQTRPGYDNVFTGKATGTGSSESVRYDAGKRGGGQQVAFYEEGAGVSHAIGSSSGGQGTLRFTPSPGVAGERKIVARATVDGIPIPDQVIARYHYAGATPAGLPGKVSIRRKGTTLIVSWQPAKGAVRYGIVVDRSSGAQQVIEVSAKHPTVRITGFPATEGGTVTVSARGALGDWGPARQSAPFKAVALPFSIFRLPRH